ncbi:MAG TPA: radical SAM protein [Dehalococcoidia bacterium]|nr:radical SAM protein [Dehalococcoidia bacterium]
MSQTTLLINTNVIRPPVSPIGLEYAGESLVTAGLPVRVLDLVFETDWRLALANVIKAEDPLLVGLTVRNTDDCSFTTRRSFLPWISEFVSEVRRLTGAFILLGGVGFSVMPEAVLRLTGADAGIYGDGEETLPALVKCLMDGKNITHLPNLVYREGESIMRNHRVNADLRKIPPHRRDLFNNRKYEEQGAMVGIETTRGCPDRCIFCADVVAKGSTVRLRPPAAIVQEIRNLLAQGVSWFHTCDSEFNRTTDHVKNICRAIIEGGLGDSIQWYAYCSPVPFDSKMASLMKRAGCKGINFGVDSLSNEQLIRLGRGHTVSDVEETVKTLKKYDLNYMFDLLVGGPGETPETVRTTIDSVRRLGIPLTGIAAGMRVYPGTPLAQCVTEGTIKEGLYPDGETGLHEPVFYMSPGLGNDALQLIHKMVSGDQRFLFLASPSDEDNYNYADDDALSDAIRQGARGAFWDIISRNR